MTRVRHDFALEDHPLVAPLLNYVHERAGAEGIETTTGMLFKELKDFIPYKNAQGLGLALKSLKEPLQEVIEVDTWTGSGNVRHWRFGLKDEGNPQLAGS